MILGERMPIEFDLDDLIRLVDPDTWLGSCRGATGQTREHGQAHPPDNESLMQRHGDHVELWRRVLERVNRLSYRTTEWQAFGIDHGKTSRHGVALMSAWIFLGAAIVLEVCGTTCLKLSQGFTRPLPMVGVVVFYLAAFGLLSVCLKSLEVGVAYAMWSGLGTALIAILGMFAFGEGMTWPKGLGLVLIICGSILLNLASRDGAH